MNAKQRLNKIEKTVNLHIGQREIEPINFYSITQEERDLILDNIRRAQQYCDWNGIDIDKLPEMEFIAIMKDLAEKGVRQGDGQEDNSGTHEL